MGCINVSQKKDLVIIKIAQDAKFEEIKRDMKSKVNQLKKLYKEDKMPIQIVGKVLKNKEIDVIEEIVKEELDVEIDFDMPRELGLSNIKTTFQAEISVSETKFHKGSLRSGQKIEDETKVVRFQMSAEEFKGGLSQVMIAASNDMTRPALTGVYFNTFEGAMYLAATDGYRLAERKLIDKLEAEVAAIVPDRKSVV